MRRLLVGCLASLGLLFLLLLLVLAGVAYWALRELEVADEFPAELPATVVLELDLRGRLEDRIDPSPLALVLEEDRPDLSATLLALERAAADPRVAGLIARIDATDHGLATVQELRTAVLRFRAAGKFALAHAESLGDLGGGSEGYYLATAFEDIALQPTGTLGLVGLLVELPYLGGLLERLGVEAEVEQRAEYKTSFEIFTRTEPSPAAREMVASIADELFAQMVAGMAEGRGLGEAAMRDLIDEGPYTAREALALGLVDRLEDYGAARARARSRAGDGAGLVALADYLEELPEPDSEAVAVAFIRAAGLVQPGSGGFGDGIYADSLVAALEQAAEDPDVRGVLLRLESGGGAASASEAVRAAIARVREAGKPVVVSLQNDGASGAYWMAVAADRILAQPATLTGSIGVVAARPVLVELWQKLGVRWYSEARGENAGMLSLAGRYDVKERARVAAIMDSLYVRFIEVVAEGRGLSPEAVLSAARGRVWTGSLALARGLVDRLGGLYEAKEELRRLLDLPPGAELRLVPYPEPEGLLGWLSRLAGAPGAGADLLGLLEQPLLLAPVIRIR